MSAPSVLSVGRPHVLVVSGIGDIGSVVDDIGVSLVGIRLVDATGVSYVAVIGILSVGETAISSVDSAKGARVLLVRWWRASSRCPSMSIGVVKNTWYTNLVEKMNKCA